MLRKAGGVAESAGCTDLRLFQTYTCTSLYVSFDNTAASEIHSEHWNTANLQTLYTNLVHIARKDGIHGGSLTSAITCGELVSSACIVLVSWPIQLFFGTCCLLLNGSNAADVLQSRPHLSSASKTSNADPRNLIPNIWDAFTLFARVTIASGHSSHHWLEHVLLTDLSDKHHDRITSTSIATSLLHRPCRCILAYSMMLDHSSMSVLNEKWICFQLTLLYPSDLYWKGLYVPKQHQLIHHHPALLWSQQPNHPLLGSRRNANLEQLPESNQFTQFSYPAEPTSWWLKAQSFRQVTATYSRDMLLTMQCSLGIALEWKSDRKWCMTQGPKNASQFLAYKEWIAVFSWQLGQVNVHQLLRFYLMIGAVAHTINTLRELCPAAMPSKSVATRNTVFRNFSNGNTISMCIWPVDFDSHSFSETWRRLES